MIGVQRAALWARLQQAGLASGELPEAGESPTPWAVRLMLGIAGWLGALFLLGFVGAAFAFVFRSDGAALPVGAICCVAAYAIFRAVPRNDFVAQFGFAVSLAGQAMVVYGLVRLSGWQTPMAAYFSIALFQAVLAVMLPNFVHRVWSTLTACIALQFGCTAAGAYGLPTAVAAVGVALVWLNEVKLVRQAALWRPVGYGFVLALLQIDASILWGHELNQLLLPRGAATPSPLLFWIGPAVTGALFVYTAARLLDRVGAARSSTIGMAVLGLAALVAMFGLVAPGICAALLVLTLGFAGGNRVLMGLGLFACGGYLAHFYYQLALTLLAKSLALMGTGAALLLIRFGLARLLPRRHVDHA